MKTYFVYFCYWLTFCRSLQQVLKAKMRNLLKIFFFTISLLVTSYKSNGQQGTFSLSGTVIDSVDGKPLPGAIVYLSNTTIGTSASDKGRFTLDAIPTGNYELIISFIGYKTLAVPVNEQNEGKQINIGLRQEGKELDEITVRAKKAKRRHDKYWKTDFQIFRNFFLGTDNNGMNSEIANPDALYFSYDPASHMFEASAIAPLIILNNALGYKIYYELQSFSLNIKDYHVKYLGYPKFEELPSADEQEILSWKANRRRAYYSSMRYFLLTLKNRELEQKGIQVNKLVRVDKDSIPPLPEFSSRQLGAMLHGRVPIPAFKEPKDSLYPVQSPYDSLIEVATDGNHVKLRFNNSLRIFIPSLKVEQTNPRPASTVIRVSTAKSPDKKGHEMNVQSPAKEESLISIITMTRPQTFIDENGVLADPLAVSVEGAWAFRQVADLLPFDYRPTE